MGAGRIRLDGNRMVALAGISRLEAQRALAADGEERDVCSRFVRGRTGRTRNLRGSAAACIQDIEKFSRIGHQRLDGVDAAGGKGRVLVRLSDCPRLLSILKPEI